MNTTRGRVHLNERREFRTQPYNQFDSGRMFSDGYELPDAPENPDFEELFTPERATAIERRFANGIELGALYDARAARLAREESKACHARFHKPRRPGRKQRTLTAKLGDVAPRSRQR